MLVPPCCCRRHPWQRLRVGLGPRAGFRLLFLRDLPPERGDLDHLRAEADVRQAEAASDDEAVPEQLLDLIRVRVGADVEIFRRLPSSRSLTPPPTM